jgi:superfamily I DNA/RNA helicase
MTLNSLGHRAVMSACGRVQLEANKVRGLVREVVPADWHKDLPEWVTATIKLVSLAKAHALAPESDDFPELALHHGLEYNHEIDQYARKVLRASTLDTRVIDFDDQLYLPVMNGWLPRQRFDVIFVDEAQDVSTVQRQLIAMALKPGGRVVAVGDRRQAIYGFRGADSESLQNIVRDFNAVTLPLDVTYRCPRAVVALANTIAPEIKPAPDAPEGTVTTVRNAQPGAGDLVLCRNNAPLLSLAFSMLASGRACTVMGRDIGTTLINFLQRFRKRTVGQLVEAVANWRDVEMAKAVKAENGTKADAVDDRAACVFAVAEGLPEAAPVGELVQRVKDIFAAGGGATLSSVHRAKGLEARDVYILEPKLMPSRFARQPWQKVQEDNLMYVAYTRAQSNLYFMG